MAQASSLLRSSSVGSDLAPFDVLQEKSIPSNARCCRASIAAGSLSTGNMVADQPDPGPPAVNAAFPLKD